MKIKEYELKTTASQLGVLEMISTPDVGMTDMTLLEIRTLVHDARLAHELLDRVQFLERVVHAPLIWATQPPTEAGWYWATKQGYELPVVVEVIDGDARDTLCVWHIDHLLDLSEFTSWAGPITVPEEAK